MFDMVLKLSSLDKDIQIDLQAEKEYDDYDDESCED